MPTQVRSTTSLLVDAIDILPRFYRRVVISAWVELELSQPGTPDKVGDWMLQRPVWMEVITSLSPDALRDELAGLDRGEREAIILAAQIGADQIAIDEQLGRAAAKRLGLQVIGTLGILREAAQRNLINLPEMVKRLQGTNFRIAKSILEDVLRTAPES